MEDLADFLPPATLEVSDAESGLKGYLAIDSIVGCCCGGGLRMMPDVTANLMAQLARGMTLKYAFLGIPIGGAKAGIVCAEGASNEDKMILLRAFGSKIRHLLAKGIYNPGTDMGTDGFLIRHMLEAS
ncbi:MAG: Glu/Leu/Phe/Val dehydrogenase dimerization domain-containing protein, partial [Candidatus Caldarchaeum sp.]